MSREFDANDANYLVNTTASWPSNEPITMACWFWPDNASANRGLMGLGNIGVNNARMELQVRTTSIIRLVKTDSTPATFGQADTTATFNTGAWNFAAGVLVSDTSRLSYCNGLTGSGSDTTNVTDPTIAGATVGIRPFATPQDAFDGKIAWPCFWNAALSTTEIDALAKRAHPLTIRPNNIIAFWGSMESTGGQGAVAGTLNAALTEQGTVPLHTDNPLVAVGGAWRVNYTPAAGGGISVPTAWHHMRNLHAA